VAEARRRIAVVLFNLGGPDSLEAVRPFLFNLFNDPAIIGGPEVLRLPLAAFVSRTRARYARANYARMGGSSPQLGQTQAQASGLQEALASRLPDADSRVFVAMRYWRPFVHDVAAEVAAWKPDEVVLLPLYPQYSTTTTGSSLKAWRESYKGGGSSREVCCYYDEPGFIEAHAKRIRAVWENAGRPENVRLLFSAHGLPERLVKRGDPYQWQVEASCRALAEQLQWPWDWRICYQSRVGPLKWIGPSTPEAIIEACKDGMGVLVDPIAFVSEHIETLVELDRDYARLARKAGCKVYLRAMAVGVEGPFIDGLASVTIRALSRQGVAPDATPCPGGFACCPTQTGRQAA
jgi:ferrochelatase